MRRIRTVAAITAAVSLGLLPAVATGPAALAATRPQASQVTHARATKVGTFSFAGLGSPAAGRTAQAPPHQPMNKTLRHTSAAQVPGVTGTAVTGGEMGGFAGFNGLNDYQQVTAGTGPYTGTQFDLEPPDQGLCVNAAGGRVVEAINLAAQVFDTSGTPLTQPAALNQLFGQAPEYTPTSTGAAGPPFGPFLSDPKCYYDPATSGWFLTVLSFAVNPSTGAFTGPSQQLIAVTTGDPSTSTWSIYSYDTTDPGGNGCPCFGDQPLIGADANGFYITTNEYSTLGSAYNGAKMYALSKAGLEDGTNTAVTELQPGTDAAVTADLGGVAFSIQPATSPSAADFDASAGGTEYFQSALDFGAAPALGTRADRIAVWSLTNTSSLAGPAPDVALHVAVLPSELYAQPPNAEQAPGALVINKKLPLLDANDDRMNQVVYQGGHLWSGLNTAVKTPQGPTAAGIAWFATSPATSAAGDLAAALTGQGYVAVNEEDVIFPSIGVNDAGAAVMAFTLTGPDYHPSAAYAPLTLGGAGPIYVAAAGAGPEDGFTSLKAYGGTGSDRWGDYSAAVADTSGTVWMATEYISGGQRTPFADWATYVYHVTP